MIQIGAVREETLTVDERTAINFLGVASGRVLATPQMIQHMEITSRNLLKPMLDDGYDSVGTVVSVRHLGATPIGMEVIFRSEILSVDERRVTFKVTARDSQETIGEGTHERFIVNVGRFAAKIELKLAAKDRVV